MDELTEIVKDCKAGKIDAKKKLYLLFQKKMFGLCLRYSKDYTEAEDIAQEGFLRMFKNIGDFRGEGSFEGWVKKIMVNTALERYKKKNRLYIVEDYQMYDNDLCYDDIIDEISAKDLLKLIQELSPQYKTVFNLYAIEGYSHAEISEMLGISEGTSKSNLSRARTILQEKVRETFNTDRVKLKLHSVS